MAAASSLPLFARKTREKVKLLVIRRLDDGRWGRVPQMFQIDDMPTREAVRDRFGGGQYEVIGRDKNRIVTRTRFILDGPSRPLDDGQKATRLRRSPSDSRRFSTLAGAREALVFDLFSQGLTVQDVTRKTEIEVRIVRSIYLDWITPSGTGLPKTPEQIAHYETLAMSNRKKKLADSWE